MGKFICSICGKKKPLIHVGLESWAKCSRHGVICPDCSPGGKLTSAKCPKCGNKLKPL